MSLQSLFSFTSLQIVELALKSRKKAFWTLDQRCRFAIRPLPPHNRESWITKL
ncbi:hypothetical protein Spb1_40290 [Planctopirus ephydatiae]|uniref:Uncharacterized protein n=1 Tax=Planctopirus ephydatiae TaxID=2528019 RepID=A0A518GU26_9PLAN|nr:hypothetical protein Spb1_40290 [Planctopirus ephydatiae]